MALAEILTGSSVVRNAALRERGIEAMRAPIWPPRTGPLAIERLFHRGPIGALGEDVHLALTQVREVRIGS